MPTPYLFYDDLITSSDKGGYVEKPKLSQLSSAFLLSVCQMASMQWLWQSPLDPITETEYQQILDMIRDVEGELMASFGIGTIIQSVADLDDESTLLRMDGQVVSEDDYETLYSVVPSSWISGSDITLPDMDAVSIHGGYSGVGSIIGSNTHALSVAEMPAHTHVQNAHSHLYNNPLTTPALGGAIPATASLVVPTPLATGLATPTNQNTGGDGSHNNVPESLEIIYYIVAL